MRTIGDKLQKLMDQVKILRSAIIKSNGKLIIEL